MVPEKWQMHPVKEFLLGITKISVEIVISKMYVFCIVKSIKKKNDKIRVLKV